MLYRIHGRLTLKGKYIEPGSVHALKSVKPHVIDILLKRKRISPVRAPPLSSLPGWKLRAERLGKLGIDVIGFLEMTDKEAARRIDIDPRTAAKWRRELNCHLSVSHVTRSR